jgi:hypothetical protein
MDAISKFTNPGLGFLLTLVFGFWLARVGKPYNGLLFNIHKLIALGAVILSAIQIYNLLKASPMQTMLIVSIVVTVLGVVALFASGAFMSIGSLNYQAMKIIHYIGLSWLHWHKVFTIYFLSGRNL